MSMQVLIREKISSKLNSCERKNKCYDMIKRVHINKFTKHWGHKYIFILRICIIKFLVKSLEMCLDNMDHRMFGLISGAGGHSHLSPGATGKPLLCWQRGMGVGMNRTGLPSFPAPGGCLIQWDSSVELLDALGQRLDTC